MSVLLRRTTASSSGKATSQEEVEITENEKVQKVTEALRDLVASTILDKENPELHKACRTLAKALDGAATEDKLHDGFESVAKAMLTLSTFAAGITFNLLLKPSNPSPPTRAFIFLAYANALFCAALVGCALVMVSVELVRHSFDPVYKYKQQKGDLYIVKSVLTFIGDREDAARYILGIETSVVAAILFVAIYLLLYASSLFLQVPGPLIVGSILYGMFGAMACFVAGISLLLRQKLASEKKNPHFILHLKEHVHMARWVERGAKLVGLGAKWDKLIGDLEGDESGNAKVEAMEMGLKERE